MNGPYMPEQSIPPQLSREQEEELFQSLLRKLPAAQDRHHLEEATIAALQQLLHRPADREVLDTLRRRAAEITHSLPEHSAGEKAKADLAHAAWRCVELLQQARRPRPARDGGGPAQRGPGVERSQRTGHPHKFAKAPSHRARNWALGLGLLAILAGGGAWLHGAGGGAAQSPAQLAAQMEDAAAGNVVPVHAFGGPLRVEREGSAITVVAERVPPQACVSTGWSLIHKGVISVNGVTPQRVTAAKLSDLCHDLDEGATLAWQPKAAEQR